MSQAEELVENLGQTRTVNPATEEHIVIDSNRNVTVPESLREIAVQYDHNIETVTFDCPRYWDGHDLFQMNIYVNVLTPDGRKVPCPCDNKSEDATDPSIMHFDWTIHGDITEYNGSLKFLVCVMKTGTDGKEELHWNSKLNEDMYVVEGLECLTPAAERESAVIEKLLARMDAVEEVADTKRIEAIEKKVTSNEEGLDNLSQRMSTVEEGLNGLEAVDPARVTNIENDLDLTKANSKLSQMKTELEGKITNATDEQLRDDVTALTGRVGTVEGKVSAVESKLDPTSGDYILNGFEGGGGLDEDDIPTIVDAVMEELPKYDGDAIIENEAGIEQSAVDELKSQLQDGTVVVNVATRLFVTGTIKTTARSTTDAGDLAAKCTYTVTASALPKKSITVYFNATMTGTSVTLVHNSSTQYSINCSEGDETDLYFGQLAGKTYTVYMYATAADIFA